MIKKIWTDPVWSKVISVGIIGLISLSYAQFLSISEKVTFKEAFDKVMEMKIPFINVLIVIIVYWIVAWISKIIFKKEKKYYSPKQEKLRSFNKTTDSNTGILLKWTVYFHNENPFISDLTVFCTKHGEPPIKFIYDRCPIPGCENSKEIINQAFVKNLIESDLIDQWEKMK